MGQQQKLIPSPDIEHYKQQMIELSRRGHYSQPVPDAEVIPASTPLVRVTDHPASPEPDGESASTFPDPEEAVRVPASQFAQPVPQDAQIVRQEVVRENSPQNAVLPNIVPLNTASQVTAPPARPVPVQLSPEIPPYEAQGEMQKLAEEMREECLAQGHTNCVITYCGHCGYPVSCPEGECEGCGEEDPLAAQPAVTAYRGPTIVPAQDALDRYPFTAPDGSVPPYEAPETAAPGQGYPRPLAPQMPDKRRPEDPSMIYRSDTDYKPPNVAFDPLNGTYKTYVSAVDGSEYTELPRQRYTSLDDFLAKSTGRGKLTVRAIGPDGGPLPDAKVWVVADINDVPHLFHEVSTDHDGAVARLSLPTPSKQLSYAPAEGVIPYAFYDVAVEALDGTRRIYRNVTIFDDTESVQVADFTTGAETQIVNQAIYVD